ncbi:hypothetical protein TNCV_2792361 [Trichonephila clavipes]|nr:hypothetical protein TNCV_2792361 [Trichonephila clavipes]
MAQITPPAATANELWQRVEAALSAVPQEPIQSVFESMSRRVAAVISTMEATLATDSGRNHISEVYKFDHLILGQHAIYKINFVVLSLVFLGVAFTVASSVISFKIINPFKN